MVDEQTRETMFDLYKAWCRDQGLDPSKDEHMQSFLNDVFKPSSTGGERSDG